MQVTKIMQKYIIRPKSNQLALGLIFVLLATILIPYGVQLGYSQSVISSTPSLKFFKIKVALDKSVVPRGQEQSAEFSVVDAKTNAPIAGAIVRLTVTYPAGTPVRQLSSFTDSSGHATLSFHVEGNAPLDTYTARYDVFLQGYAEEVFTTSFAVIGHGVNNNNNDHNDHNDHHKHHHDHDK
jgi:hypothetical protein